MARPVPASILAILGQRRIEDIVAAMAAIHDLALAREILKAEASGAGRPSAAGQRPRDVGQFFLRALPEAESRYASISPARR
jgi:hypothetical protein